MPVSITPTSDSSEALGRIGEILGDGDTEVEVVDPSQGRRKGGKKVSPCT